MPLSPGLCYKKALKLDQNNILCHYRLGYAYHLMRRLMEASSEYEIVLRLDPPQKSQRILQAKGFSSSNPPKKCDYCL